MFTTSIVGKQIDWAYAYDTCDEAPRQGIDDWK